ncbi:MAG: hypothetical protein ACR2G4_18345 [Pyrinomonadaceae bacterium]
MKLKIFIVVLALIVAWAAGRSFGSEDRSLVNSVQHDAHGGEHGNEQSEAEGETVQSEAEGGSSARQINQSFRLADGAQVDVLSISGPVSIEAVDGDTAEVHITSAAGSAGEMNAHQITVEQTSSSLVVRGKENNGWGFWRWLRGAGEARHNVTLKLPRRVKLSTRGINGKVSIGEMQGTVQVSGINGRVEIAGATGAAEVNGVNGGVSLTIRRMSDGRVRVNGINGVVELRLGNEVNADLNINGLNGSVAVDAPNVEVQEQKRSKMQARIGTGGAEIKVNGINGGVRLVGI